MAKEKKEKQSKQLICESREELYDKAVAKLKADSLIVQFTYKIENYRLAAAMFEEVGDYQDAPRLKEQCLKMAAKTEKEERRYRYQGAVREMDSDEEKNWLKLAETFQKLGDYHDSKERYEKCKAAGAREDHKRKTKAGVVLGVVVLLIAAVIGVFVSGANRYVLGVAYLYAGTYDKAMTCFESVGDLLDAPAKAQKCRNKQILTAKKGEDISFGCYQWKIMDRDVDARVLTVIASSVGTDHDFYQVAFDDKGKADSWEESSLRAWLNGPVLEDAFTEEERACLILQDSPADANPDYQDRVSGQTQDHLKILSASEAAAFMGTLRELANDCWLRTPGRDPSTFCYITGQHKVRNYGLPAETMLTVRPVIQIDYSGLG